MKPSSKLKTAAILISTICFLALLNLTDFSKEIRGFFYSASYPVQKYLWESGSNISGFFDFIIYLKSLEEKNSELLSVNQKLLSENVGLRELKKENEILRKAFGIGLQKDFHLILTEVIGKDQDFILINKGEKDGVLKGLPVITAEKALCGKVDEVYNNFSKVMLISNNNSVFDAKIQRDEIYGVVEGKGNSTYFSFVPQVQEIKKEDIIITASLGGIFPAGLLVGQVKSVKRSDVISFQEAEIEPFFNIKNTENLFIIK